jgi:hypothetical protein
MGLCGGHDEFMCLREDFEAGAGAIWGRWHEACPGLSDSSQRTARPARLADVRCIPWHTAGTSMVFLALAC